MPSETTKTNKENSFMTSIIPEQATMVHRIFGGLVGVWIGFIFSKNFPPFTNDGISFILYTLFFISILVILLQKGFSNKNRIERIVLYVIIIISCIMIVPGIVLKMIESNTTILVGLNNITLLNNLKFQIQFLSFIIPFWCVTAELSTFSKKSPSVD